MPKIKLIAAIGKNRELGNKGGLPVWHLKDDMKRFKELTSGGVVVMGRKTYESFAKFNKDSVAKPLPNRTNVVITRDTKWHTDGVLVFPSPEAVIEHFKDTDTLWIIGGGEIYRQFLKYANELHITHVEMPTEADTFFPEFDVHNFASIEKETVAADERNSHPSKYILYTKKH